LKIHELEKERAGLIDRKEELEAWIENRRMSGDYNPDTTKVRRYPHVRVIESGCGGMCSNT